jgi:hypothetical protein
MAIASVHVNRVQFTTVVGFRLSRELWDISPYDAFEETTVFRRMSACLDPEPDIL